MEAKVTMFEELHKKVAEKSRKGILSEFVEKYKCYLSNNDHRHWLTYNWKYMGWGDREKVVWLLINDGVIDPWVGAAITIFHGRVIRI